MKPRILFIALSLLVAAGPRLARADSPEHAVSLQLMSLSSAGVTAQYERAAGLDSWSIAASLGARGTAAGDYSSVAVSAGAELRYWFTGRAVGSDLERAMIGPFTGARIDIGHTTTRMDGRTIGSTVTLAETLVLGYRFACWERLELTPTLGLGLHTDVERRGPLPASTRATVRLGLTMGWMY